MGSRSGLEDGLDAQVRAKGITSLVVQLKFISYFSENASIIFMMIAFNA